MTDERGPDDLVVVISDAIAETMELDFPHRSWATQLMRDEFAKAVLTALEPYIRDRERALLYRLAKEGAKLAEESSILWEVGIGVAVVREIAATTDERAPQEVSESWQSR